MLWSLIVKLTGTSQILAANWGMQIKQTALNNENINTLATLASIHLTTR